MTNQEMLTIVKMRGWRLRSSREWPDTRKRKWYVEDENGAIAVMKRNTKGEVLQWAIALITDDQDMQDKLRMIETNEMFMNAFHEWRKGGKR